MSMTTINAEIRSLARLVRGNAVNKNFDTTYLEVINDTRDTLKNVTD